MTFSREYPYLREALKTEEGFLDLLQRAALHEPSMVREDERIELAKAHPDAETLQDYVSGILGREETSEIMKHLSVCRVCAREALEVTRVHHEMTEELLDWVNTEHSNRDDR